MSDREKVIEGLKHCSEDGCKGCPYGHDCDIYCDIFYGFGELAKDALELLKEQEPKLVRYTASTVRCPNCNKQITTKGCIHREIKYCWKCGQAVKWE